MPSARRPCLRKRGESREAERKAKEAAEETARMSKSAWAVAENTRRKLRSRLVLAACAAVVAGARTPWVPI